MYRIRLIIRIKQLLLYRHTYKNRSENVSRMDRVIFIMCLPMCVSLLIPRSCPSDLDYGSVSVYSQELDRSTAQSYFAALDKANLYMVNYILIDTGTYSCTYQTVCAGYACGAGHTYATCTGYYWFTPLIYYTWIPIISQPGEIGSDITDSGKVFDGSEIFYSTGVELTGPSTVGNPSDSQNTFRNRFWAAAPNIVLSDSNSHRNFFRYRFGGLYVNVSGICSNGQYAETAVPYVNGFYVVIPNCLPCVAGTWATCKSNTSCTYHVYGIGMSRSTWIYILNVHKDDINVPVGSTQTLVGQCYPCTDSGGAQTHYGFTGVTIYGFDVANHQMPVFCPGGSFPPVPCAPGSVAFVIPQTGYATDCVCSPGFYGNNYTVDTSSNFVSYANIKYPSVTCNVCNPGYYCVDGYAQPCPLGTYSSFTGMSICSPCTTAPCPDSATFRPLCPKGSTQDALVCISCLLCSNLGSKDPKAQYCLLIDRFNFSNVYLN